MQELKSMKSQIEQERSATLSRCTELKKDIERFKQLSEERNSEIAGLSSEVHDLHGKLQESSSQLKESKERELQFSEELNSLELQTEQGQCALLDSWKALEQEVTQVKFLLDEKQAEVSRLNAEAEGLQKELQLSSSHVRESQQRELQLADEVQQLKLRVEQEQCVLSQRCSVLEKDVEEAKSLAEERQLEVAKLTSESENLRKELQASIFQLDESRQKEFHLVQELESLKLKAKQEQDALLECFRGLENDVEGMKMSKKQHSDMSGTNCEGEGINERLQPVSEGEQLVEGALGARESEVVCTRQELLQTRAFHNSDNEEQHTSVAQLKEKLTALLQERQRLSAAEHDQQKRVRELEESLQEVRDSLGKQLFEAEALAKSYEEQLHALQERLGSSTKTMATHQPSDGQQQQPHKSETSGHTDKVDEEADMPAATHGSGWDDAWPDEEEWGPRECPADERIEALQMTLGRYRDEINDLRCILRAQQNNNATNHTGKNPVQLPEPTEYEYLRNILFEYMMGKETMTLSKVIAAVLKFSDEQKNQILQRQEARQPQVNSETSSATSVAQVKS
ncbi:hypothetical protein MTO96_047477 [Rhipicephalus appendiculatus]